MIGFFVILLVLGFLLAWVVGIVAREEISIPRGMAIVFLSGVVALAAELGLQQLIGPGIVLDLIAIALSFGSYTLFIQYLAKIGWKPSAIVAGIYAAVTFAFSLLFAILF